MGAKIVILGAGFGGFAAAMELERLAGTLRGAEVTLLDRNNYQLFVPLLYHVATGGIEPGAICVPVRATLRKGGMSGPVAFRECEINGIDLERRAVLTEGGAFPFDYLVLALGSVTNFYGIPGCAEHIMPLKTVRNGIAMHNRILSTFEAAMLEPDERKRRELLTFVIVGGGPTGVELSSTVAIFVFKTLARDFPELVPHARVILVEAGNGVLRGMRPALGRYALPQLKKLGVEVVLESRVASASAEGIQIKDGPAIPTRNVTWVAGVKPSPLVEAMPLEKAKDGRVIVDERLAVASVPGLFVIGDCAYAMNRWTSKPYPATAQAALRMGRDCARIIAREINGLPPRPFDYKLKGDLVFIGRNYGTGDPAGIVMTGWPAFMVYQTYHIVALTGMKNRLTTLLDWAYDYFYRRNTAKLD